MTDPTPFTSPPGDDRPVPAPGATASDDDNIFRVSGTVRGRNDEPLRDARVVVWWQQMRTRTELVAGATSQHGTYHLPYRAPRGAPKPVLLVVEALSEHLDEPLYSPLTPAQPELTIDLSLTPTDQSEWATLVRSIEPLLEGVGLSELVQDQTHQDISFLAQELSQNTEVLMRVAVSARLGVVYDIPAPAFYAFLRQRVPAALPSPLLDASQNFTLIDPLVQNVASTGLRAVEPAPGPDADGGRGAQPHRAAVHRSDPGHRRQVAGPPRDRPVEPALPGRQHDARPVARSSRRCRYRSAGVRAGARDQHQVDAQLLAHPWRRHFRPDGRRGIDDRADAVHRRS